MAEEKASRRTSFQKKGQAIIRALWLIAGTICLVLGAIGIVLPVLPTTPFLLAAAACYYKSSPRMHKWLLNNKWFGEYIRNYKEGKGLPLKTKISALALLWLTIGVSTVFMLNRLLPEPLVLPIQIIMITVAIAVSAHILKLPTFKKTKVSSMTNTSAQNPYTEEKTDNRKSTTRKERHFEKVNTF